MNKLVCFEKTNEFSAFEVGNKAYNLFCFGKKYPEINIPQSFVIPNQTNEYAELMNIKYPVIARSSSTVEDSELSFAGVFESYVCDNYRELIVAIENIRKCVCAERVVGYCNRFNVDPKSIHMAVLIQKYLQPQFSGVTFTKNPLSNNASEIYTEYGESYSDIVTSGTSRTQNIILHKNCDDNEKYDVWGIKEVSLKAEEFLKHFADIEWIIFNEKLFIVQIRPITT